MVRRRCAERLHHMVMRSGKTAALREVTTRVACQFSGKPGRNCQALTTPINPSTRPTMLSRRNLLAASAVGAAMTVSTAKAASFGNPDEPPQGAINAKGPGNLADPGPQNRALGSQFPSAQSAPATDVGGMPTTWASFNNAPKRIQNGGWARQVTVDDFAISKEISGVNMRLTPGGIRELHWHQAAEWAIMTYGY